MRRIAVLFLVALILGGCTNYEETPEPGVLEVYFTSNPDDIDSLGIRKGDLLPLGIREIVVYREDSAFSYVYPFPDCYEDTTRFVNVFEMEDSTFVPVLAGQTYFPPGRYTEIYFTAEPYESAIIGGRWIPIVLYGSSNIHLPCEITIDERDTTRVILQFEASQSVYRWRDEYRCSPVFTLIYWR
jgi:hypothetical protein